jgi:hypothetical protein
MKILKKTVRVTAVIEKPDTRIRMTETDHSKAANVEQKSPRFIPRIRH